MSNDYIKINPGVILHYPNREYIHLKMIECPYSAINSRTICEALTKDEAIKLRNFLNEFIEANNE